MSYKTKKLERWSPARRMIFFALSWRNCADDCDKTEFIRLDGDPSSVSVCFFLSLSTAVVLPALVDASPYHGVYKVL